MGQADALCVEGSDALLVGKGRCFIYGRGRLYVCGSGRGFFYAREHYAFSLHVYLIDINIINFIFNICS